VRAEASAVHFIASDDLGIGEVDLDHAQCRNLATAAPGRTALFISGRLV